jgi:hypothetical protein
VEKKLAKVKSATLEIKERGILNFWVFVDYEDGFSQGVGGICLDDYDKERKTRVGTAYGCEMIRQLLLFFNVNNLEECKGQMVYVTGEGKGLAFNPNGFEHLRVNDKFQIRKINFNEIRDIFSDKGE